ncbi:putative membrane protein [Chitinispirillum alkaliphilum]|nr:putative membrane protein [Chitinispirillum alkaliphilum]
MEQAHSKLNRIIAIGVFVAAFIAFFTTVAPTVAFWDCGEYIAAGHSLGIAHPPGNPFFVLLMRVSSMAFQFFDDVGYRMNLTIVLASAMTAVFIYLAAVRVIISFTGIPDSLNKKITVYTGGITAALFAVFGYTFWFSAVETSVYNVSMLVIAICTWLMLVWHQSTNPLRDRILVLVTFLAFLGISIHMYTMVVLPSAFLFMILVDEEKRYDWRLWTTGLLMASVLHSLSSFIVVGPVVTITLALMAFVGGGEHQYKWRLCFWMGFFAILGYSVHTFIPIRSALEPIINMNHPDNLDTLIDFLERRQYGNESMLRRMFWRRGALGTQFGIDEHMGYGGFHLTQFFRLGEYDTAVSFFKNGFGAGMSKLLTYLLPTFLMLYGWYYLFKKNRPIAIFLISLVMVTTIGMVFYMNFADGTRPERAMYEQWIEAGRPGSMPLVHREVRIRDYFFTAGFMFFGMWIGIAASCLLHKLFSSKDQMMRSTLAPVCALLLIASPAIPLTTNYSLNNRSNDWVAFDYAYNLLMSCEENGILITTGDNDTYPLWALQEAYGIRTDVRVVNLSLLNTGWYIKQIKDLEPKVPIRFTDEEIDSLKFIQNPYARSTNISLRRAGITVEFPGFQVHNHLRIQDRMLLHIIDANAWKKPIYISMSVGRNNLIGLEPYLKTQGFVHRVVPEPVSKENMKVDIERTRYLLNNVYQFRSLGEEATLLTSTSYRTASSYLMFLANTSSQFHEEIRILDDSIQKLKESEPEEHAQELETLSQMRELRLESAIEFVDLCLELFPWEWRLSVLRHELYMLGNREELAIEKMKEALERDPDNATFKRMLNQAKNRLEANQTLNVDEDFEFSGEELETELIPQIVD